MDVQDYKWIVLNCHLTIAEVRGEQYVGIFPKWSKDEVRLNEILEKEKFPAHYPTMAEFSGLSEKMAAPLQASFRADELRQEKAEQILENLSAQEIAAMSQEDKVKLLDRLFLPLKNNQDVESNDKNRKLVQRHKDKFHALLYHVDFPKDFVKDEEAKADRFSHLLGTIPNLKENLENWKELAVDTKLEMAKQMIDIFEYVYGVEGIQVKTFTNDDYLKNSDEPANCVVPTGYAVSEDKEIFLNADRLGLCANDVLASLVFHEALHIYQKDHDFSQYANVEKLFQTKYYALNYDKEALYMLVPGEQHAYNMDKRVKDRLFHEKGIKFVDNEYDAGLKKTIKSINDKAYAAYNQKLVRSKS